MTTPPFKAGDRVRAAHAKFTVRVGMVGTVVAIAEPRRTICVVQFDGLRQVELIPVQCLEPTITAGPGQ